MMNEAKLQSLLESYNVQQRECASLQMQVEQKEAEKEMKAHQIMRFRKVVEDLKCDLVIHRKKKTQLLENLKNNEKEIKIEKADKNESYLKIVAAEDSIRGLREKDRINLRRTTQELKRYASDAFKSRSSFRDVINFDSSSKAADGGVEETDCPSQEMKVVEESQDEESQDGPQSEEKESDKDRDDDSLI